MKQIASIILCVALLVSVFAVSGIVTQAQGDNNDFTMSSAEFAQQIKAGWNLGNTMEATGRWGENWSNAYTVNDVETGWGNPTTTQAMFDKVYAQGFNAVRIPVSWYRWADANNNYTIKSEWMNRIKTIVSYAYKHNMYVIVNMHHDDKDWLDIAKKGTDFDKVKTEFAAIWKQIATTFKDYDNHLILEGLNEPVAKVNGSEDWYGKEDYYFTNLNELYKVFVDTVRATGGNNAKRYLMIPTFGAQRLQYHVDKLVIPNNDTHIIIDTHCYDSSSDPSQFEWWMKIFKSSYVDKGIGVVIGETGINRTNTDTKKVSWSTAYYVTARTYGLPVFIWDDGGDFRVLVRSSLTWVSQALVDNIINIANGETPTTVPTTPAPTTKPAETPENNGQYKASSTVYYNWSTTWYHKTEGWQSNASNLDSVKPAVQNGVCTWDLNGFLSQQLNTNWSITNKTTARKALTEAKNGSGYLIFTITLNSIKDKDGKSATGAGIKHNISGAFTEEKSIFINTGESKEILVNVKDLAEVPDNITLYFQQFEEGMTEINATISSVCVAVPVNSTTATTKPTTATTKPTTATTKPTTVTTKPTQKTVLYGDADNSGKVDIKDLLAIKKYIVKISDVNHDASDVNLDGNIDIKDMLLIKKYIVGIVKQLGVK